MDEPLDTPTDGSIADAASAVDAASPDIGTEPDTSGGADGDLDALLSEFNSDAPQGHDEDLQAQQRDEAERQRLDQLEQQLADERMARVMERHRQDMSKVIADVRGDQSSDVFTDSFVTTWIDNLARLDPSLQQVWLERDVNPGRFVHAVDKLARRFHKEVVKRQIDDGLTEDRMAISAAVRGTARPPERENDAGYRRRVANMTDAEFHAERERMMGS